MSAAIPSPRRARHSWPASLTLSSTIRTRITRNVGARPRAFSAICVGSVLGVARAPGELTRSQRGSPPGATRPLLGCCGHRSPTTMSATIDTAFSPAFNGEPAPTVLSGLTVVLPCLDEAENLLDAVALATDAAGRYALAHEIVVVDDGSSDDTVEVAAGLAARDPRIRLVVHSDNRGYGEALRSGIAAARLPWGLLIDADLQFDVRELGEFVALTPSADLVVGWRFLPQGPVGRRAGSALWNRFVHSMFDLPARDVDCGFRLVRRELVQRLDLRARGAL